MQNAELHNSNVLSKLFRAHRISIMFYEAKQIKIYNTEHANLINFNVSSHKFNKILMKQYQHVEPHRTENPVSLSTARLQHGNPVQ